MKVPAQTSAGLTTLSILIAIAIAGPWLTPYAAEAVDLHSIHEPPSAVHWLGTDDLGRDLVSRLLSSARVSLAIGILSALGAGLIGVTLGGTAGFCGGWIDNVLMRITEVFQTIPLLPLTLALGVIFQPGIGSVILIVGLMGWMETARVTRAGFLSLRESGFVEAARAAGAGTRRIVFRHLLPNVTGPLAVATTIGVGRGIIVESGMSFFGVGVQPPSASWGNMLYGAQSAMTTQPWLVVAPGLLILITVVAVNFAGDGLNDMFQRRSLCRR
jgi:peptide/nickel transport system permease protein